MANYYLNSDGSLAKKKKKQTGNDYRLGNDGKLQIMQDEEDIAPVTKNEKIDFGRPQYQEAPLAKGAIEVYTGESKWYQKILQVPEVFKDNSEKTKNLLSDGFQLSDAFKISKEIGGDTAKTIGGTVGDAGLNFVKGIANVGEGLGDLATYGQAQVLDWMGKDARADQLRRNASVDVINNAFAKPTNYVNQASVLGETGDKVAEGIGYMTTIWAGGTVGGAAGGAIGATDKAAKIGTIAGQATTTFTNSAGTNMADIYQEYGTEGVKPGEAWGKALGSAAVETVTEQLFGMFGHADTKIINGLAKRASSTLGKTLTRLGGQAVGEGIEEILAYAGNYVVDRIVDAASKGEGATFAKEWSWEDVWEQAGIAALTAFAMGGGQTLSSTVENKTSENSWSDALTETAVQEDVKAQEEMLSKEINKLNKKLQTTTDVAQRQEIQQEIEWKNKQLNALKTNAEIAPTNTMEDESEQLNAQQITNEVEEEAYHLADKQVKQKYSKTVDISKLDVVEQNGGGKRDIQYWVDKIQQDGGVTDPIEVAITDNGKYKVYDGHHRLQAAQELGLKEIPVAFIQEGHYTDVPSEFLADTNEQKTYYHGTRGDFDTFDNSKIGQNYEGDWSSLGKGFYFSNDYNAAKEFGEASINDGEVTVKEATLDIKNPFFVDDLSKVDSNVLADIQAKYELGDISNGYNLIDELKKKGLDSTEVLKQYGYDSVVAEDEVMVFDANQIKTKKQGEKVQEIAPNTEQATQTQEETTAQIEKTIKEAVAPLQETVEKLTEQLNTVVNSIEENTAPTNQDIVEQQGQEAFETITDEQAPIDVDNRSFEDVADEIMWETESEPTTESKVESPFDSRDIKEVGKRNVKAYQYENPEVRPYFQEEAQNMLYDLDNTIKGERSFNDQLYYDSNGEQGWFGTTRQTTEAIAYLKDNYGYSYAQIRKGLNDIIEDNGKENNAVAKRIEFMLDERLREGYTTSDGIPIPANEDYINFLKEKQVTEYNKERLESLAIDENVPEVEEITDTQVEQADDLEQYEATLQAELSPTVNTVQNRNTELTDTSIEAQEQEKIAEILSERPTQENKKQRLWAKFKAGILDKGSVFEDLSIKNKNRELMSKWDYMLTAEARAQSVMINGHKQFDSETKTETQTSKSLNDIQTEVGDKVQEFSEYLYHNHNISRMSLEANAQAKMQELQATTLAEYDNEAIEKLSRKRITEKTNEETAKLIEAAKEYVRLSEVKNKPVFGESVTAEVSQEIVNEYEMNNPEFMDWAKDVYDYNKADLDLLVQSGVISQETADLFAEMYPYYVPIGRAEHLGNAINVPLDTNRTTINTPIKGAKGGNGDILPLFDTMARRTMQTQRAVAKNNFGVELKNTLKGNTINQTTNVDEVLDNVDQQESLLQEGKDGKAPTFTVFENGEKVTYNITQDMYEALKPVSDSSILNTTFKPLNKVSNFHRGVLTEYNPVFMFTNATKDVQDILVNSQHAAKTYAKIPEAFKEITTGKGYWINEYMSNGGEQNSYFDSQEGTFDTERKGIAKVLDTFPLKQISKLNNIIEMTPRLAEYIASREAGRSIETSMLDAARVTTNFKAGGDITKWANRNGATFLNASIQGAMQQVRNVREANANGLKGYANLATKFALVGVPAMILNALLWGDDDEYEELSDYVKQNYWIVGKYGDGNFIRIPKGRMVSVIQESFNQMKHLVTGDGEADLGQFLEIMGNNIAPNNPIENNVLSPIIGAATNTTWYGDDLVPTRLQDEPVTEQFDESTDKLSIFLGQKLGISPYKINYVLDQYSGGIGDVLLPMMTQQAETGTDNIGEKIIAPLTNKFTVDSVMKNQNVSDLYSKSEELTSKANSTSATDEDILKNKYLNSIKSEMNVLYKEKREIQNSSLPDSEKYNQVREMQKQINSMAKNALETYENIERTDNYATIGEKEYYKKMVKNDDGTFKETWEKVEQDELNDLSNLNMDIDDKSAYFNLKSEISSIEKQDLESNVTKKQIATVVKNADLTDEQKAYVYGKSYSSDKMLDTVINSKIPFNEYLNFASQEFKADTYSNGATVKNSRRDKVVSYVNSLNLSIPQKAILIRTEYPSIDTWNYQILDYLNGLNILYQDKLTILDKIDMKISKDGYVTW